MGGSYDTYWWFTSFQVILLIAIQSSLDHKKIKDVQGVELVILAWDSKIGEEILEEAKI
jgi:hypothetical protein